MDVTYESRLEYVELVERARLAESARQTQAVRRGLVEIVPANLLQVRSPSFFFLLFPPPPLPLLAARYCADSFRSC